MGFNIGTILGSNLGQMFKDIVGTFKLDHDKKAELEKAIDDNEQAIKMKEFELTVRTMELEKTAIETASANIRAEAQSGDKFTARARPTFLYLFYVILAFNFIVLPVTQMIGGYGQNLKLIEFPQIMWEVFVAGFLGYTGVRTWEKLKK
jgi:hypothetical protein